ncbi:MAG: site-specific integrase, partial [Alcaligenes sp.]
CFRFEPWLDGPHEAVLARLEEEREKWSTDSKMATINDAAIIAVREVIAECAMARTQRAEGSTL